jgi:hypothetical protein
VSRHARAFGVCSTLLLLFLAGCATEPIATPAPGIDGNVSARDDDKTGWWYARFRLHWPEGGEPAWHRDLLLADQVIRPTLAHNRDAIALWRFHRRAARDGAGHQFSFIFRTSPTTAARIYAEIRRNPTLVRLRRSGAVASVGFDDLSKIERPGIADTSDTAWSPQMQAAWPAFIMGVSQLWLELIEQIGRDEQLPRGLDARYRAIDTVLDDLWRREGSHALLHHLNALFGYRPVIVTTRAPMRF